MTASPAVEVVVAVLTWRNEQLTRECVVSLTKSSRWPFPVLIVDNASGTGEGVRLAAEFGDPASALTLDVNGGVPGGYNAALRWAARSNAEYVLLLNNDTICTDPAMLDRLIEAAVPGVGAIGPVIRDQNGVVRSAGGTLRWRTGRAGHIESDEAASRPDPYEAEWLDGSCLLVSVAAAREVGGLAEDFFLYWEEVDWCVRARRQGFRCLVQPRTSIVHLGSASVAKPEQLRYWMRNKLLFMRRNGSKGDNLATLVAFVVRTVPYHVVRQGFAPRRWVHVLRIGVLALGWNIADAARRRSWTVPAEGPTIADDSATAGFGSQA